jgi:hypothetical protein
MIEEAVMEGEAMAVGETVGLWDGVTDAVAVMHQPVHDGSFAGHVR